MHRTPRVLLTHAVGGCEGAPGSEDASWHWRHPSRGCNTGKHAAWQGRPRHHGARAWELTCEGVKP